MMGATPTRMYLDKKNTSARVWTMPFEALKEFVHIAGEDAEDTFEVDFTELKEQEQKDEMY